jgi:hypothetical protein
MIERSEWRIALQMFEEGRMSPSGYIHVVCSEAYFGTAEILERIVRLTPELEPSEIEQIQRLLREQRPATEPEPQSAPELAKAQSTPGLSKTHAAIEEHKKADER